MICNLCIRRLTDCCELKFKIEKSEQLLLSVVSNRLFMVSSEYSVNDEQQSQQSSKSNLIISDTLTLLNDFESSHAGYEIITPKLFDDTLTVDIQDISAVIEQQKPVEEPKPFKCLICSKKFTISAKLDSHLINHHLVRNDLNIHKPHQCDDCEKSYTTKANLVLHRAVHTGERINKQFHLLSYDRSECSLSRH